MKKITSKQIFTYAILLGIIAIAAVYFLVYKKKVELAEQTRATNMALAERVESLKVYHINEAKYLEEMEPLKEEIDVMLAPYPADVKDIDLIMQAVNTQAVSPIHYTGINLGNLGIMQSISSDVVVNAGVEKYQEQIDFCERTTTYTTAITYEGLKEAVQSLFDSEYLIGINSISYTKTDGEGGLMGTMDLAFYSVSGTGKEYVKPEIPPYVSGTENIFGLAEEE